MCGFEQALSLSGPQFPACTAGFLCRDAVGQASGCSLTASCRLQLKMFPAPSFLLQVTSLSQALLHAQCLLNKTLPRTENRTLEVTSRDLFSLPVRKFLVAEHRHSPGCVCVV